MMTANYGGGRVRIGVATRGEGYKDGQVIQVPCIADITLEACSAISEDGEKTWTARVDTLRPRL